MLGKGSARVVRATATATLLAIGTAPPAMWAPAAVLAQGAPTEAKAPTKTKSAKAAPKKADESTPEQAEQAAATKASKAYEGALKLAQAGRHEQAVQGFTAALADGKLPKATMAKALYQRGVAQRKLGKPAQAIADLTSASWLKDGLDDAERADALAQRSAAYKDAGLAEPGGTGKAGAATGSTTGAGAAEAPPINWSATTGRAKTLADGSVSAGVSTASPPTPAAQPSSGLGSFFGGLFGGSAAAEPEPKAVPAATVAATPTSAVSSWTQATEVAAKRKEPAGAPIASPVTRTIQTAAIPVAAPVQVAQAAAAPAAPAASAAAAPAASAAAAPNVPSAAAPATAIPTPKGKYRLQVAAVRSPEEASAIAKRLQAEYGPAIGARVLEIDKTVHGNMGTFYRVDIGPYHDARESQALCGRIRAGGLDCMVITR